MPNAHSRTVVFQLPRQNDSGRASFQLRPGAITCLLGGNGSGKTTLFNLITGFLRPDAGSIGFGATELTGKAPFHISRLGVGRTFQDLRLIGKLSVRENVLLALPQQFRLMEGVPPVLYRYVPEEVTAEEQSAAVDHRPRGA